MTAPCFRHGAVFFVSRVSARYDALMPFYPRLIASLFLFGIAGLVSAQVPEDTRSVIPSEADQREARKLIREVFADLYAQRDPEGHRALAATLFQRGRDTHDHPAARFVMLEEATDHAVDAGDTRTAMRAIDALASGFAIDPVQFKLEAVTALARGANAPEEHTAVVRAALGTIDQAITADRLDTAATLLNLIKTPAQRSDDADLVRAARQWASDLSEVRAEARGLTDAVAVLESDPDDPDANLRVGRYRAVMLGDWAGGLPMLAKSADPEWLTAAQQDLLDPPDAETRVQLADQWLALGERERGVAARHLGERARFWYRRALPGLAGLTASRVAQAMRSPDATAWGDLTLGRGLVGDYYNGKPDGKPAHTRVDNRLDFNWGGGSPARGVEETDYAVRWTGYLYTERPGEVWLSLRSGGVRTTITLWDETVGQFVGTAVVPVTLVRGYNPITIELTYRKSPVNFSLGWNRSADPANAEVLADDALMHDLHISP